MIAALVLALACHDPAAPDFERRIVHLADGSCLRVAARVVEGGFEVRAGDGWRRIDSASVSSANCRQERSPRWKTARKVRP